MIEEGTHVDGHTLDGAAFRHAEVLTVRTLTTGHEWARLRLANGHTTTLPTRLLTPAPLLVQPTLDI